MRLVPPDLPAFVLHAQRVVCVGMLHTAPRHLDRLGNLGDMPTEMFIDLLQRAKEKATPEIVQRLQDENEVRESKKFIRPGG